MTFFRRPDCHTEPAEDKCCRREVVEAEPVEGLQMNIWKSRCHASTTLQ
jgi:hypothetical protein